MSSINKCKNCGSTELDTDSVRGDLVCTNCGTVLEDNVIVSEIQFEENAHGGSSALGHFVSSDSKGGCQGFGGALRGGLSRETREITLERTRKNISFICSQLRINQHCLDTAFNMYKMALSRQLTKGRRNILVCSACVYMTCRLEGTSHLLIDFSELLQICVFDLGRTYLRLSQALCLNIPSQDPCLYVMRYSNQLEFGKKSHEVAMTALRILQRMKKDMIHAGRRPSALIGAALLIAARWHDFGRTVGNIVKVVRTTEHTLKKRLLEFGDTPSSLLTLDEFMSVDLEEEQDPPAYKQTLRKDSERVQHMIEDEDEQEYFHKLQDIIEKKLSETKTRKRKFENEEGNFSLPKNLNINPHSNPEEVVADEYLKTTELPSVIKECLQPSTSRCTISEPVGIGPTDQMLGMVRSTEKPNTQEVSEDVETLSDLDDDEIDRYILTEDEAKNKMDMWFMLNKEYLKLEEEKKQREELEGKKEKKKRKTKTKSTTMASTPGEAIEKILKEKKISSKINYDVLRSLGTEPSIVKQESKDNIEIVKETVTPVKIITPSKPNNKIAKPNVKVKDNTKKVTGVREEVVDIKTEVKEEKEREEEDFDEDDYFDEDKEDEEEESLGNVFRQNVDNDYDDDY